MRDPKPRRVAVLTICIALFTAIGTGVKLQAFVAIDRAAAQWFAAQVTSVRTLFAFVITTIGSDFVIIPLMILVALKLRSRSPYWMKRFLITVSCGIVGNEILKFIFYRKRPQWFHPLLHLYTNSFPSGHSCTATVTFGTLMILIPVFVQSKALRVAAVPAGTAMIVLIAASRLYLGVHYLSDVIGGMVEGIAWINGVAIALASPHARTNHREKQRPLSV